MNILTFDIEEWFVEETIYGFSKEKFSEFDRYLGLILDTLDEKKLKGTFFCVGGLIPKYDYVIKQIAERGHEIGCHSNHHHFLNKMTYEEVLADTKVAVEALEQLVGKKMLSYRAPAFSIGESNKWVFEILAECGIERDASIYPATRDLGGFPNFGIKEPCMIEYAGIKLKEFPICTTTFLGGEMAYSGGGYFRFFPLRFVKKLINSSPYSICYFHIDDLLPEIRGVFSRDEYESYYNEKGSMFNRYKRYYKSNLGKKNAWNKLKKLIRCCDFVNLEMADKSIDWINCPIISF